MLNKFDEMRIRGEILSLLWEQLQDEYTHAIINRDDANEELKELPVDNYHYSTQERIATEYAYRATAIKSIMDNLDRLL